MSEPTTDTRPDCWCVVHGPSDRCRTAAQREVERLRSLTAQTLHYGTPTGPEELRYALNRAELDAEKYRLRNERLTAENERLRRALHRETAWQRDEGRL